MNDTKEYKTAKGADLKVRVCDSHGNTLPEGAKLELPELKEFLSRVYAAKQPLADSAS